MQNYLHPITKLIPYSHYFAGVEIYFRPLSPVHEEALQNFFHSHQPQTIYYRYLKDVHALTHEEALARVTIDYNKDMGFAGFDSPQPSAKMLCIGRYIRREDDSAEMAIVVKENYQLRGIGTFLVETLIKAARNHGITKLIGYISHSNLAMLRIVKKFGFELKESRTIEGYQAALVLSAPSVNPQSNRSLHASLPDQYR